MAIADHLQFAPSFKDTFGVAKHLPSNVIRDRLLLMERGVA
ncbi:hypothetical protein [Vibrio vulnificus YJ016]|uniref:Uncharacterized protein n=1 Tax=Vibrio vulnificus (strain YJ016) TaxID=196600 RepID=Q7MIC4_VIBVY|nr:hypothetical protein [Vibrio vulnificus YJ016]